MKTIIEFFKKKYTDKTPISIVTCYDHSFATIISQTDIDCILVGDSLGMVFQGNSNTLPVTLDEMIYHTKAVKKGSPNKWIIADMPFLSYQISTEKAIENAGRLFKESGCDAIKLEGMDDQTLITILRLHEIGMPVMGHVGLTPQYFQTLGGFVVQGKNDKAASLLKINIETLVSTGVFSIVLEMIPEKLAQDIQKIFPIPMIGIGAGRNLGGQVLVLNDLLGMNPNFSPKFLKKYADLFTVTKDALTQYDQEVKKQEFPAEHHIF
jgi:3-methyl-2-oxobutanoate hydroxymethyltransferase